jgi:hypothetical protein
LKDSLPEERVDAEVTTLGEDLSAVAVKMSAVAVQMHPVAEVLDYFPTTPQRRHLHIIVQPPSRKSSGWSHPLDE